MSALQELQLLEIMCSCFQEQSRDTVRQLMFSALFSLQRNQADESRMSLLSKLVSMAIAVGRVPILECAATWLQVESNCFGSCCIHLNVSCYSIHTSLTLTVLLRIARYLTIESIPIQRATIQSIVTNVEYMYIYPNILRSLDANPWQ